MISKEDKQDKIFKLTLALLGFLYVSFLLLDLLVTNHDYLSNILKWSTIIILAVASLILAPSPSPTNSRMIRSFQLAALLTVLCDYLLLFTSRFMLGVFLFCLVQVLRFYGLFASHIPYILSISLLFLALFLPIFLVLVLIYAFLIVSNLVFSFYMVHKTNPSSNKRAYWKLATLAYILFIFCDISVALAFIGFVPDFFYPLQWFFYLPSQVLLWWLLRIEG